jgi:biopolymer transport protein ExbB/TolQ
MDKKTIAATIVLALWIISFSYWAVLQNKASANEEIINLQKRNLELEQLIQQAKDNWHIAENAKAECVESWNNEQKKEQKKADAYREELQDNQDKLGLMLQSQLQ